MFDLLGFMGGRCEAETIFSNHQVWTLGYPFSERTRVVVGKVELWKGRSIVHISILNMQINSEAEESTEINIDHLPFDELALSSSVRIMLGVDAVPVSGFEQGYNVWKSDRKAGVFDVSVWAAVRSLLRPSKHN
jgi:hypothetical protein